MEYNYEIGYTYFDMFCDGITSCSMCGFKLEYVDEPLVMLGAYHKGRFRTTLVCSAWCVPLSNVPNISTLRARDTHTHREGKGNRGCDCNGPHVKPFSCGIGVPTRTRPAI